MQIIFWFEIAMDQDINESMISNHDSNKLNWNKLNYNENPY